MSVSGLCGICQVQVAAHRCPHCGTFACNDHFREPHGLCVSCAAGGGDGRFQL